MPANATKILIETTIPNYILARRGEKSLLSKKLLEFIQKGEFQAYITDVLIEEIEHTPKEEHRKKLVKVLDNFPSRLLFRDSVSENLADKYIKAKIIPAKVRNDALQVAIATTNLIPTIVTWNLTHLANLKNVEKINSLNSSFGYPQLKILTPYELVGYLLKDRVKK